jgi:hypothetical protein
VVFIALLWVLGGYINTMSNVLAPRLVPPQVGWGPGPWLTCTWYACVGCACICFVPVPGGFHPGVRLLCICSALDKHFDLPVWLQLKGAAAGMMAIAYQVAHFVGLATATLVCWLMFGSIGVE